MGFRENLKEELSFQGMLVKELAIKTGISKHTLDHYLAQDYILPSAENALKIAQILGVSVEYLLTGTDSTIPTAIKPEIIGLVKKLNHLNCEDLKLVTDIIIRLDMKKR